MGQKFDPHVHQAMFEVPNAEVPSGTVVQVVQSGYVIGDRVLRPPRRRRQGRPEDAPTAGDPQDDGQRLRRSTDVTGSRPLSVETVGVAVFALSGALVAARKGMDPFGFALLATVTGVGGGTLRDLLIGADPVFWVGDPTRRARLPRRRRR